MRKISTRKRTNSFITEDGKSFPYEGLARSHERMIDKKFLEDVSQVETDLGKIKSFYINTDEEMDAVEKLYFVKAEDVELPAWVYLWEDKALTLSSLMSIINQKLIDSEKRS